MGQEQSQYSLVGKNRIVEIRPLDDQVGHENDPALARVYLDAERIVPIGSPIEVDFRVPGKGEIYRARGYVKISNDGSDAKLPRGIGVHLYEVFPLVEEQGIEKQAVDNQVVEEQKKPASHSATACPIPTTKAVSELVGELLGDVVQSKKIGLIQFDPNEVGTLAVYSTNASEICVLLYADMKLTCNAGGALTMLQQQVVATALASGKLTQEMNDNFREIVNIATSLFNSPETPYLKLSAVYVLPTEIPSELTALIDTPANRLDLELTIPNYGPGKMTLYFAPAK